ncbi:MAG TPA: DUF3054 domain-containing protein [Acidimicrobiia bacterium]
MTPLPFRRVAPVLDAVCLVVFVAIGREQHDLDSTGVGWFLTVLWPLAVGWIVGALVTRVYVRSDWWWLRLVGTVAVAALLDALLRGTFTDRGYLSVFTIVLFLFNCLTTFAWRAVWLGAARVRRPAPVR